MRKFKENKSNSAPFWIFFAVVFSFYLSFTSGIEDSPVNDEPETLLSGYLTVAHHEYRYNPFHPPVFKQLFALPLVFGTNNAVLTSEGYQLKFSPTVSLNTMTAMLYRKMFSSSKDNFSLITICRLLATAVAFLGLFAIYFITRNHFNESVAVLALLLNCFHPLWLAHSHYTLLDVPSGLTICLALYSLSIYLRQRSAYNLCILTITLAAALLTKFSGIITVLVIPFALIFASKVFCLGRNEKRSIVFGIIISLFAALWLINIWYIFSMFNTPVSELVSYQRFRFEQSQIAFILPFLEYCSNSIYLRGIGWFLTGFFGQTFLFQGAYNVVAFSAGEVYSDGRITFFPLQIILKEPVSYLILFILAVVAYLSAFIKKRTLFDSPDQKLTFLIFVTAIVIYFIIAISGNLNVGVRHLLPIYPLVFILVGFGLSFLVKRMSLSYEDRSGRTFPIILWKPILAFLLAGQALFLWPHYLSFYNYFAGGTEEGYRWGSDSNYDWGQDIFRLNRILKENKIETIYADLFTNVYNLSFIESKLINSDIFKDLPPKGSFYAVSLVNYQKLKAVLSNKTHRKLLDEQKEFRLGRMKLFARAGTSILLFQVL